MARASSRPHLHSADLLRVLRELDVGAAHDSRQDLAESLGQWLEIADAIAISAALHPRVAQALTGQEAGQPAGDALVQDYLRVQNALDTLIRKSCSGKPGEARLQFPSPAVGVASELAAFYTPFHRFYLAVQREMDAQITPLRALARQALAQASPRLKPLALLDAALEHAIGDRERRLLGNLPLLLEQRFVYLLQNYLQGLAEGGQADQPEAWLQPGGWLAVFRDDLQRTLLAELALRLLPVAGIKDVISNEVVSH